MARPGVTSRCDTPRADWVTARRRVTLALSLSSESVPSQSQKVRAVGLEVTGTNKLASAASPTIEVHNIYHIS